MDFELLLLFLTFETAKSSILQEQAAESSRRLGVDYSLLVVVYGYLAVPEC
jgi:hypothetical protein